MRLCLISLVLSASNISFLSYDMPTVQTVLQQYEATRREWSSSYIRSETLRKFSKGVSEEAFRVMTLSELYRKDSLVDLYMDNYHPDSDWSEAAAHSFRRQQQLLWDGSNKYEVHTSESDDHSFAVITPNRDSRAGEGILSRIYPGRPLEGYVLGDAEDVLTILRDQPPATTRIYAKPLNEVACYVIEADITGRGTYSVWFDPAHGYNICRAEVTRTREDGFFGTPVSQAFGRKLPVRAVEFLLHDVSFAESSGVWFPVSGRWRLTTIYENGESETSTFFHRCIEAQCGHDDLKFAEAFVPHVRDGTVVQREGRSHLLREEWTDGKPQLVVDWDVIAMTDGVVDKYVEDLKQRGATISLMYASARPSAPEVTSREESGQDFSGNHTIGTETKRKTRTHCGLYCIYAAARASGGRVSFTEFLKPEYLGSTGGSSVFELKTAARDHGFYAEPVEKLTTGDLKRCPYCCILHVKPSFKSRTYSHYVLFLGMRDDAAVLYDGGNLRQVPLPDLAPLWRGRALLLASEPIDLARVVTRGYIVFIASFVAALGMVVLARKDKGSFVASSWCSRQNRLCLSALQGVTLGLAALIAGLANNIIRDTGMLANRKATTLLQQAHSGDFVPRIGLQRAQALLTGGATFVDARFRKDYQRGCMPGAINIPVDANDSQYENTIATIPRDAPIVVYCQSAHCGFAGEIAGRLTRDDFPKVSVFRGGWYEWATANERKGLRGHDVIRGRADAG